MKKKYFCSELQKNVVGNAKEVPILDGNSVFSAGVRYTPSDCLEKCKLYERCKIIKFENLKEI